MEMATVPMNVRPCPLVVDETLPDRMATYPMTLTNKVDKNEPEGTYGNLLSGGRALPNKQS